MRRELELVLHPDAADPEGLRRAAAAALGVAPDRLTDVVWRRRTIDARHGNDLDHARRAFGQRARLVEHDLAHGGELLKRARGAEQDAHLRRAPALQSQSHIKFVR